MKITFLGHACFLIEMNGKHILFDPFITGNEMASDVNIDDLNVDYIFLTHGHQDHVLDVEAIAKNNPDALLVSNFESLSISPSVVASGNVVRTMLYDEPV